MPEDRLMEIEIKLARQEDTVEALNQMVYRQQKKIDELEALCSALARRIRDMQGTAAEQNIANEKPPNLRCIKVQTKTGEVCSRIFRGNGRMPIQLPL